MEGLADFSRRIYRGAYLEWLSLNEVPGQASQPHYRPNRRFVVETTRDPHNNSKLASMARIARDRHTEILIRRARKGRPPQ